jgi:signal peptidase I
MAKPTDRQRTATVRTAGPRRAPSKASTGATFLLWLWEWTKSIGMALLLFLVIRTFIFQTFTVISGSMEKTLLVSDWLVLSKAAYGATIPGTSKRLPGYAQMQRHDIVVFRRPESPGGPMIDVVKRIIGMPGDTLSMRNQALYLNGKPAPEPFAQHTNPGNDDADPGMLWQRQYLTKGVDPATYVPSRDNWGPIVVPPGQFFMMGDNRDESLDSRYWGFLDPAKIKGRASFIYYSYDSEALDPFPWIRDIRWNRVGRKIQ